MRAPSFSLALLLGALCAPGAAWASTLVPHRAVYDLDLADASERSGVTAISGRMVYEFAGSPCDGYTVTFRFVSQIDGEEVSRLTDQQTTSFEAGDGMSFDFSTRSFVDGTLENDLRGRAQQEGEGLEVSIEEPEPLDLDLAATHFPTHHLMELIENAREGARFYETTIFDGSDGADKVMTTTIVIGNAGPADQDEAEYAALGDLTGDAFWPVDMAYFDMSTTQGEELPTYRISFRLHESGVSRDLVMDYGDFAIAGTLVELSMFEPADDCPAE